MEEKKRIWRSGNEQGVTRKEASDRRRDRAYMASKQLKLSRKTISAAAVTDVRLHWCDAQKNHHQAVIFFVRVAVNG